MKVAALFVDPRGCYANVEGVDPWPEERDARRYMGKWPVVAHPPCARWGRYANGGPRAPRGVARAGYDNGCFLSALSSVNRFGGVLEHPRGSHAWLAFGLLQPHPAGGWVWDANYGGWVCCVEQGHYGHRARKPTWLYVNFGQGPWLSPPDLIWGESHCEEVIGSRGRRNGVLENLSKKQRAATPPAFRDVLLRIARMVVW